MSRLERLLDFRHNRMEVPVESWGNITFPELVEEQLKNGKTVLAIGNLGSQIRYSFELANLYWGQGNSAKAEHYFTKTLERHKRLVEASRQHGKGNPSYSGMWLTKAASIFLKMDYIPIDANEEFEIGYEPWFKNAILDYCLGTNDFDAASWQASEDKWTKSRFPKYRLKEFRFYIDALTGQFKTAEALLSAHEKMFKARAKRRPDADALDGYDEDNVLFIDHLFASVLARIDWEGRYRHSWPDTDEYDSVPQTWREPDNFLDIIEAPQTKADARTGIIADKEKARRYIDHNLKEQLDEDRERFDADRAEKTRSKVSGALREIGWIKDPASLDLMRHYRMDHVLNVSTHIFLADPIEGGLASLKKWTSFLQSEFGLHSDFIAIAASEEKSDYRDPQGSWYVLWKKDRKIYAVERDDWHDLEAATKNAQLGLTLWPSYTSFVAWWISEHLDSEFFE